MTLTEAKIECQKWLDYLDRQKEKSTAIQKVAAQARQKNLTHEEAKRQLRVIDDRCSLTVYDGARLAEAVQLLISQ